MNHRRLLCFVVLATVLLGDLLLVAARAHAAPLVTVSPPSGPPGTTFTVTGTGFPPGTTVAIRVFGPDGQQRGFPGFSQTDASGAITAALGQGNETGIHTVRVGYGRNLEEFTVTATFTVEPAGRVCFPETGKCMQGRFAAYWFARGQLRFNGYPISDVFVEVLEDGKPYLVQYFERVRMEYHPENAGTAYEVLLGHFGRRIYQMRTGRDAEAPVPPKPDASYFPQTGHNVSGLFQRFLVGATAEGGADFGYPLTEEFIEVLEDGKPYLVQYFERARFEYHPENAPEYQLLLGQFGRLILGNR